MAKNTKRSELGKILKELRESKNMTQDEVSDYLKIKRDRYARYETDTNPPLQVIKSLSRFYGVSTDIILGETEPVSYLELINNRNTAPHKLKSHIAYNTDMYSEEDSEFEITEDEKDLIEKFRKISQAKQEAILILLDEKN